MLKWIEIGKYLLKCGSDGKAQNAAFYIAPACCNAAAMSKLEARDITKQIRKRLKLMCNNEATVM